MKDLKDKIVLITGAGGGFGKEFIRHFINEGSQLILSDLTTDLVENNLQGLNRKNVSAIIEADLSTSKGVLALFKAVKKTEKKIDMLINNAGIANFGPFHDLPQENWQRIMQINTMALMQLTHLFLPDMISKRSGHIVNLSSIAGHAPAPGLSVYNASKFAVRGFSLALQQEVEEYGIKVTVAYPFFAKTNILDSERFGVTKDIDLPDYLIDAPDKVINEVMQAIKNDQLEIFPSLYAKTLATVQRYTPWLGSLINDFISK